MQTPARYKSRAKMLRAFLKNQGIEVSQSFCLEAQAAQENFPDWNAFAPTLDKTPANDIKQQTVSDREREASFYSELSNGFPHDCTLESPLVSACRPLSSRGSPLMLSAQTDFSISDKTIRAAALGCYTSPEDIVSRLSNFGVSEYLAHSMLWVPDEPGVRSGFHGLVVCFLADTVTGNPIPWGYRPRAFRATEGPHSFQYVYPSKYDFASVYLESMLDGSMPVIVSGFMHALALRERGVNAVAIPDMFYIGYGALQRILAGGHKEFIVGFREDEMSNQTMVDMAAEVVGAKAHYVSFESLMLTNQAAIS